MIPIRIQLKNFLSYGPEVQTIDFSNYQLICLSGKNGHGKSALLDAITWAIWGQARKVSDVSKPDEGLLKLGQTQMMVILDFTFNGTQYRIRREFAKTYGKPLASLEFGIVQNDTDQLIPLTEKTLRGTQAKIESMLNLDAESFINSAFLRQGHSNEFSKKSSKERKEILANILGIARYELIRKAALEKIKHASAQKNSLDLLLNSITTQLEQKSSLEAQKETIEKALSECTTQESMLADRAKKLHDERTHLSDNKQKQALITAEHDAVAAAIGKQQQQLLSIRKEWRTIHSKMCANDYAHLDAEKKSMSEKLSEQQVLLQKNLEYKEAFLHTKDLLQQRHKQLTDAHQAEHNKALMVIERLTLEKKATELQMHELSSQLMLNETEKKAYAGERQSLEKKITESTVDPEHLIAEENQFEKRKAYYQKFVAQGNFLKSELENLAQKKLLAHDEDNPSCPLCEQNLSASRKKFLKTLFTKQEHLITHQLKRLATIIKKLKALLVDQHAYLSLLKKNHDEHQLLKLKLQELGKAELKIDQNIKTIGNQLQQTAQMLQQKSELLTKSISDLEAMVKDQTQAIEHDPTYKHHKALLRDLEAKIKATAYNANEHQLLVKKMQSLEQAIQEYHALQEQSAQQKQRAQQIHALCQELKQLKKQTSILTEQLRAFDNLTTRETDLQKQEQQLQLQAQELRLQKEKILEERGKVVQQCALLIKLEKDAQEHQTAKKELDAVIDDYQAIANATSKDGIQALLIEDALPEIEEEANRLLSKLTNNQAHIIIESLRDLKKGGAKETLDIKISDPAGIRPYELFSGGEAFRIDFALRIAISKLLARRAGTSLQTLIIDEGFGSQDEEGLNHIMDALYKIQEDFAKIIIVSHLPAMKDQFPVHFFVEKGPNGSTIKIIEQD